MFTFFIYFFHCYDGNIARKKNKKNTKWRKKLEKSSFNYNNTLCLRFFFCRWKLNIMQRKQHNIQVSMTMIECKKKFMFFCWSGRWTIFLKDCKYNYIFFGKEIKVLNKIFKNMIIKLYCQLEDLNSLKNTFECHNSLL